MLEDHTDLSAHFPQPFFIQLCQFRTIHGHSTFCGAFQQVNASYQCGFSCTGKPDDTKNLALFNIQTYLPYGVDFSAAGAEGFAYLLQLYHVYFSPFGNKKSFRPAAYSCTLGRKRKFVVPPKFICSSRSKPQQVRPSNNGLYSGTVTGAPVMI